MNDENNIRKIDKELSDKWIKFDSDELDSLHKTLNSKDDEFDKWVDEVMSNND